MVLLVLLVVVDLLLLQLELLVLLLVVLLLVKLLIGQLKLLILHLVELRRDWIQNIKGKLFHHNQKIQKYRKQIHSHLELVGKRLKIPKKQLIKVQHYKLAQLKASWIRL